MKLGLVIYGSLDQASGGYAYDRRLVGWLRRQGHEVTVFSLQPGRAEDRPELWDWTGDALIEDELCHPDLKALNRHLKRQGQTVIALVHHLRQSERLPWIQALRTRRVETAYLKSVDRFWATSPVTARDLARVLGRPEGSAGEAALRAWAAVATPGREEMAPPGAGSLQDRLEPPAPGQAWRWLFAGSLISRKNLKWVLKALARVPFKAELTVTGPEPVPGARERAQALARRLGVADRVHWAGYSSPEALDQLYRSHHLFVLPSDYEGFGMVYLEALARGCPAVGGTKGAASYVIGNGGRTVPPRQLAPLVRALTALCEPAAWARARTAALEQAEHFPGWDQSFESFGADLDRMALEKGLPSKQPFVFSFEGYLESKLSVDDRSLAPRVLKSVLETMPAESRVLELGCGTGNGSLRLLGRGLAPRGRYTLADQETALCTEAARRVREAGPQLTGTEAWTVEIAGAAALPEERRGQADLVVAQAVLDLFQPQKALAWLDPLLAPGAYGYFSLNFDGLTLWEPEIDADLDARVVLAYHRSMDERLQEGQFSGDSRSGRHLFRVLPAAGWTILEAASSDWAVWPRQGRYPAQEAYFLNCLLYFTEQSLRGRPELSAEELSWWLARRRRQLIRGELIFGAHQWDFFARRNPRIPG